MIEVRNLLATGEALEPVRGDVSGLDLVKRPGRTPGPVRASDGRTSELDLGPLRGTGRGSDLVKETD